MTEKGKRKLNEKYGIFFAMVLTSERAQITDPCVEKLSQEILKVQVREIDKTKKLIDDFEEQED